MRYIVDALKDYLHKNHKESATLYIVAEYDIELKGCFGDTEEDWKKLDSLSCDWESLDKMEEHGDVKLCSEDKQAADDYFSTKRSGCYEHGGIAYRRGWIWGEYHIAIDEDGDMIIDYDYSCISDAPSELCICDRAGHDWYEDGDPIDDERYKTYADAYAALSWAEWAHRDDEEDHDFHIAQVSVD